MLKKKKKKGMLRWLFGLFPLFFKKDEKTPYVIVIGRVPEKGST